MKLIFEKSVKGRDGYSLPKDLFDDIDITWRRVDGGHEIETVIDKIIDKFDVERPDKIITDLIQLENRKPTCMFGLAPLATLGLGVQVQDPADR